MKHTITVPKSYTHTVKCDVDPCEETTEVDTSDDIPQGWVRVSFDYVGYKDKTPVDLCNHHLNGSKPALLKALE